MSNSDTEAGKNLSPQHELVGEQLEPKQLLEVLVKHYGLHEGVYDLNVEFMFNVGQVNRDEKASPAAFVALSKFGVVRITEPTRSSVDAAKINPQKKGRRKTDKPT